MLAINIYFRANVENYFSSCLSRNSKEFSRVIYAIGCKTTVDLAFCNATVCNATRKQYIKWLWYTGSAIVYLLCSITCLFICHPNLQDIFLKRSVFQNV